MGPPGVGRRLPEQIKGAEFSEMEGIAYFPMSENYPVFKGCLQQALQMIKSKLSARIGWQCSGRSPRTGPVFIGFEVARYRLLVQHLYSPYISPLRVACLPALVNSPELSLL